MAAQTQTRRILIKVDTTDNKAIRNIADQMGLLNKNTKALSGNLGLLTNAFRGWIGFLGVRELARLSDQMQNLENRLKIVTTDGKNSAEVLRSIRDIAKATYQPLSDVAEAYVRMGSALKGVGATTEQLGALTETLINTFRVAGTTVTETTNTMIQLSQAFSSGEVRGQELRSVLEQNATLAGYLRKEFGQDLLKKAADGMIRASDITRVLINNFDELQAQAKNLTPTFEASVSMAMIDFSFALNDVNKELGLSIIFFKSLTTVVENAGSIIAGVAAGALTLLGGAIFTIAGGIKALTIAVGVFLATNPFGWAIIAGAAVFGLVKSIGGLTNALAYVKIGFLELRNLTLEFEMVGARTFKQYSRLETLTKKFAENTASINAARSGIAERNRAASATDEEKRAAAQKEQLETLYKQQKAFEGTSSKAEKVKDILAEINKELLAGAITVEKYNEKLVNFELFKLNKEFKEGKFDVFTYNKRLNELKVDELNRQLKNGAVTLQQYNSQISANKIDELNKKFQAGKVSLVEYNSELIKISNQFLPGSALVSGTSAYIESIGTLSDNIAKGITQTFTHLEDNLVEFVKTGEINFKKFAQAVIDDITRIIIRASIVKPLAEGILSGFGSGTDAAGGTTQYSADYLASAKGNAFSSGNLMKFAKGGIVDSPTLFGYGGGKTGIMGEAGTEAILPLQRGSDGKLGVSASASPVVVNIINRTDSDISQTEKSGPNGERVLEVMIQRKVREGFASGVFDKQLQSDFGLKRKGS